MPTSAAAVSPPTMHVDHRADIYALGVVFYQMLTGELPGKRIVPPSSKVRIDVRLDEVVLRALEKNPERRYEQVSELKTDVETIAGTAPGQQPKRKSQMVRFLEALLDEVSPWEGSGPREKGGNPKQGARFAALAVAAFLLLVASGNATVMMIGSAIVLVLGLIWSVRRTRRVALLVALAFQATAGLRSARR